MSLVALLVPELTQARATQYTMAAGAAIVLYDVCLTLPSEISLIWPAAMTATKALYFFHRYSAVVALFAVVIVMGGFSDPLTSEGCFAFIGTMSLFSALQSFFLGGALILLRVFVVYRDVKYIRTMLAGLLSMNYIPSVVMMSLALSRWFALPGYGMIYLSVPGICGLLSRPDFYGYVWLPPIIFQSTVCTLLAYKAWEQRKELFSHSNLMTCLLRDGIFFNVVILTLQIVNIVCYVVLPDGLFLIAFAWDWAISTVLISRIYLNLRNVGDWANATSLAPPSGYHRSDDTELGSYKP